MWREQVLLCLPPESEYWSLPFSEGWKWLTAGQVWICLWQWSWRCRYANTISNQAWGFVSFKMFSHKAPINCGWNSESELKLWLACGQCWDFVLNHNRSVHRNSILGAGTDCHDFYEELRPSNLVHSPSHQYIHEFWAEPPPLYLPKENSCRALSPCWQLHILRYHIRGVVNMVQNIPHLTQPFKQIPARLGTVPTDHRCVRCFDIPWQINLLIISMGLDPAAEFVTLTLEDETCFHRTLLVWTPDHHTLATICQGITADRRRRLDKMHSSQRSSVEFYELATIGRQLYHYKSLLDSFRYASTVHAKNLPTGV